MTTANLVTSDLNRSLLYSSYSMDFDGTDYIDCGNISSIPSATELSVSFWANTDSTSQNQVVFGDNSSTPIFSFEYWGSNNRMYFEYGTGTFAYLTLTSVVTAGSWHNVVLVYNGSGASNTDKVKIYVDGVDKSSLLTYTGAIPASLSSSIGDFWIGNGQKYNAPFNGKMSNVSVFNKALSQNEILTIYNSGAPNDISSLSPVGWWSLSGDSYFATNWICPDLSANSNNGTGKGLPVTALVGNAPGSTSNGTGTSMNIPGNLEGNAPNSDKNAYSVNMVATNRVLDIPNRDPALAFIQTAGITDATQKSAITTLVSGLKSNGIWDKMKVIYPFIGGTDVSHSYNLKDTSLAQITWTSGVTHSSDGVQGKYGDTGVTPAALGLGQNDASLGFYTQNGWQLNQSFPLGVYKGSDSLAFYKAGGTPGTIFIMVNNYLTTVQTTAPATQAGFHQASRTLSTQVSYKKDNSTVVSVSGNSHSLEAVYNLWINQANGYSVAYGGITSLAYFGLGLTDAQLGQMNTLVTAYQTTLGRQV